MEPEYVTKWQPGGPSYEAVLPAPIVRGLTDHSPELRLIAVYYPADRDPYLLPDCRHSFVGRRLHLDFSTDTDALGEPYWRSLEELSGEKQPEDCQNGCDGLKVCRSLMNHLAAVLAIPTAAEVEAGLKWEKVPDIEFPPEGV